MADAAGISKRRTILMAGFIGNVVEWYDFALYGYMAGIISSLFFPSDSRVASLLATYGVFAAGFVMRPIGSALFGWLGDTIGRSTIMLISVATMAGPTVALGLLPTHASIGIWAPILLVIIRLVQGLSVGGEFSSSVTYLVETAEPGRRGLAGAWANVGSLAGMLLGSGLAALVTTVMDHAALTAWGWRVPFLLGGVLGLVAVLLRRDLPKSPHFQKHDDERPDRAPFRMVLTRNRDEALQGILFASCYGSFFYLTLVYLPNWLSEHAGTALSAAMRANTAATLFIIPAIFATAWAGDRLMRRTHLIAVALLVAAFIAIPLFHVMAQGGFWIQVAGQFLLALCLAVPLGAAPAMFSELFPAEDRLTGYSVAYNLGLGVVGGATPLIATWLIEVSGSPTVIGAMLAVVVLTGAAALFWMTDRSREPLR